MDGYIKKSEAVDIIVKYPYNVSGKTATAIKMIEDLPSADVVPRSEVDEMLIGKANSLTAKFVLEDHEAHIKALMAEHDSKLASEIFAEIEKEIDRGLSVIEKILNTKGGRANGKTVLISKYDVYREAKKYIAELKKKYTEGNQ